MLERRIIELEKRVIELEKKAAVVEVRIQKQPYNDKLISNLNFYNKTIGR